MIGHGTSAHLPDWNQGKGESELEHVKTIEWRGLFTIEKKEWEMFSVTQQLVPLCTRNPPRMGSRGLL